MRFIEKNQTFQPFYLLIDSFFPHEPLMTLKSYLRIYIDHNSKGRIIIPPSHHSFNMN